MYKCLYGGCNNKGAPIFNILISSVWVAYRYQNFIDQLVIFVNEKLVLIFNYVIKHNYQYAQPVMMDSNPKGASWVEMWKAKTSMLFCIFHHKSKRVGWTEMWKTKNSMLFCICHHKSKCVGWIEMWNACRKVNVISSLSLPNMKLFQVCHRYVKMIGQVPKKLKNVPMDMWGV